MKKVNGRTRAKKDGTVLRCPKCDFTVCQDCLQGNKVYHFAWSAITCQGCKEMVEKNEWAVDG